MKNPKILLQHILASISAIEKYTQGISKDEFISSPQIQDAVIRNLEIIGEATKKIPHDIKAKHNDVPWKDIAGLRDVLIHDYFSVDTEAVWETIEKDIPQLKQSIEHILKVL